MTHDDVHKLAELSRIALTPDDLPRYLEDFDHIFAYIDMIRAVDLPDQTFEPLLKNVLRSDDDPYPAGSFSEELLAAAPRREGDLIQVQKILG